MSEHKGHETIGARGIQFRSRIEATWSYVFEQLGCKWEYEPDYGLKRYIPDFILVVRNIEVLVEVKAHISIDDLKQHSKKIVESGWEGHYIILGGTLHTAQDADIGSRKEESKDICDSLNDTLFVGYHGYCPFKDESDRIGEDEDDGYCWFVLDTDNILIDVAWYAEQSSTVSSICNYYHVKQNKNLINIWSKAKNSSQWKPSLTKSAIDANTSGNKLDELLKAIVSGLSNVEIDKRKGNIVLLKHTGKGHECLISRRKHGKAPCYLHIKNEGIYYCCRYGEKRGDKPDDLSCFDRPIRVHTFLHGQ